MGLKSKTLHGLMWSGIDNVAYIGANFVIGVVLARLLSPSDYGLIAMISVFLGISRTFIDSGFGNALIREQGMTTEDCSTAFWFNLSVACFFYFVLFISAPWIADFYNRPI